MTCEDFQQRLVDYLYDELSNGDRSAVDQHLAECSSCRVFANSFEETLLTTRSALSGPLAEAPPALIHDRILSLAQETTVQGKPESRPIPNFFARIFRTPWFLPLGGAAAISAFLLLARTHQKFDFLPQQKPTHLVESGVIPPAKKVSPALLSPPAETPLESTAETKQPFPPKYNLQPAAKVPPSRTASRARVVRAIDKQERSTPRSRLRAEKRSPASAPTDGDTEDALYLASPRLIEPNMAVEHNRIRQVPLTLDERLREAENHFQAERWSDAKESYQDLIHRFPHNKNIAKWRERLNQAMAEEAKTRSPQPTPR